MIEGWKRKRETGRRMKGGEECVAHAFYYLAFVELPAWPAHLIS